MSQKPLVQIAPTFLHMLPVAVARSSSDGNAMLCTSGFLNDVMFSYYGGNRRESDTTRIFRQVHQMAAPEAKSAVSPTASCSVMQYSHRIRLTGVCL